jgi:hypothetical protein
LWDRFEIVYTPIHGSWLNMGENELKVLIGQCLNRRMDPLDQVAAPVSALQTRRYNAKTKIDWQFNTRDARSKLRRLYSTLDR